VTTNPFDNPQFRAELSEMFDAKLKLLNELSEKVEEHEAYINEQKGGGRVLHYLWTIVIAGLSGFATRWFWGAR
jgi:hypothetical protein